MKTIMAFAVIGLGLVIPLASASSPGFFRPPLDRDPPELEARIAANAAIAKATKACAILVRYNLSRVSAQQIGYVGAGCTSTQEAAIIAAAASAQASAKLTVPGEPAIAPVYDCSIDVSWDPPSPSVVEIAYAGAGCESSRSSALFYARQAVQCVRRSDVPCP